MGNALDLLRSPPISAGHHQARCLAVSPLHLELPRRIAAPVLSLGSASDAAAQTGGQERPGDRKDKRHEKQGNRQEKREDIGEVLTQRLGPALGWAFCQQPWLSDRTFFRQRIREKTPTSLLARRGIWRRQRPAIAPPTAMR